MSLVIVSREAQPFCEHSTNVAISKDSSADSILAEIYLLKPQGVWIVSKEFSMSLEVARRLRSEGNKEISVGVVSSISELPARTKSGVCKCQALLSRLSAPRKAEKHETLSVRRFIVDQRGRDIITNGVRATCSPMEMRFLIWFLRYPYIAFSRVELLHRLSSDALRNPRIVDVFVKRIRSKIDAGSRSPKHIITVQGIGYIFQQNSDVFIDSITRDRFESWPDTRIFQIANVAAKS